MIEIDASQNEIEIMRKALFLDRDGVVCESTPRGPGLSTVYMLKKKDFKLLPHIDGLIRAAREKGYAIVVITNQPPIAKGLMTMTELETLHDYMRALLGDAQIDKIYVCPHKREDNCECRKPKPTMLLQAANEMNLDLAQSIYVGDSDKDVLAGQAVGVMTIFLRNEWNDDELAKVKPNYTVSSLQAVYELL